MQNIQRNILRHDDEDIGIDDLKKDIEIVGIKSRKTKLKEKEKENEDEKKKRKSEKKALKEK